MRHQIAGFGIIKIGGRQGLQVIEQLVSQTFFDSTGGTQKTPAPDISKNANEQRNSDHVKGVIQQLAYIRFEGCQIINGPLDDTRNDELQDISDYQAKQSNQDLVTVFQQVGFDQQGCRTFGKENWFSIPGRGFSAAGFRTTGR
jgi:hypothetical protein